MAFVSAELKKLFEQLIDLGEPISASYAATLFRNGELADYVQAVINNQYVPPEPPPDPDVVDITEDRVMNLPPRFTVSGSCLDLCAEETLMAWEERYAPPVLDTLYSYSISKGLSPQTASTLEDQYIQKFMEESRPVAHTWISGRVFTSDLTHSAYPHDIVKFEAAAALKDTFNNLFVSYGKAFIDASLVDSLIAEEGARLKQLMLDLFSVLLTWLDAIEPALEALDLAKREWRHADDQVDKYRALWETWAAALTLYNTNYLRLAQLYQHQEALNSQLDYQWDLIEVLNNQKALAENNVAQAEYGVSMYEDSVDYWQDKVDSLRAHACFDSVYAEENRDECYDIFREYDEARDYLSTAKSNLDEAFSRLFIAQGELDGIEQQLYDAWWYYEELSWELLDVNQEIQDLLGVLADPDEINANVALYNDLWNEWKGKRYDLAKIVDSRQATYDYLVGQRDSADDAYNDARSAFNTWCDTYPDVCATL